MLKILCLGGLMAFLPVFAQDTAQITIDTVNTRQVMAGIGGNYCDATCNTPPRAMNPIGRYALEHLKPEIVRVGIPLDKWEPQNDDTLPDHMNWDFYKLHDTGAVHDVLLTLKEFELRGITIIASIWWLPRWLPDMVAQSKQGLIAEDFPEALEAWAAFLVYARDQYGVTIDYISINEPDLGIHIIAGGVTLRDFIKYSGPRMEAMGLNPKWLIGDVAGASNLGYAAGFVYPIVQDTAAMRYCGPLAYHSYKDEETDVNILKSIYGSKAVKYKRQVWTTECEYDGGLYLLPNPPYHTWSHGWKLSVNAFRSLYYAHSSTLLKWEYGLGFPLLNPVTMQPYPMFYTWKHLADNFRKGTRIVETISSDTMVWALTGKHDSLGKFFTFTLNTKDTQQYVKLKGVPLGIDTLYHYCTSPTDSLSIKRMGGYPVVSGEVVVRLPAKSVNTLRNTAIDSSTSAREISPLYKDQGGLIRCEPNPFRSAVKIRISEQLSSQTADVAIFDIAGKCLWRKTMNSEMLRRGISWKPEQIRTGLYIVKVMDGMSITTKSMFLTK